MHDDELKLFILIFLYKSIIFFLAASKFLGSTIENPFGFTSQIERVSSVPPTPPTPNDC